MPILDHECCGPVADFSFFSLLARLGGGTRYAVPAEEQSGYMEGTCMRDASNGQTMLLFWSAGRVAQN
jgi:hypothetical protein